MAWLPLLISLVLLTCYYGDTASTDKPTQPTDNPAIRKQLMTAIRALSNTLHKRFHKNQKIVLYAETDVEENFVFNPVEISCAIGMLISGMSEDNDFEELGEFLGYRKLQFDFHDMYRGLQQYLYKEAYNVSLGWSRKVYLNTDIFTNFDLKLLDSFKSFTDAYFRSEIHDLSKLGDETKKKEIQDFVSNRTNGFIGPFDWLSTDFTLMMSSSTYIQDLWLYSLEKTDSPVELICTTGKEEFKLRTNTRIISTWYVDQGDRFGVIVPFRRASLSIYFYVPKTEDLFLELDEYMDYQYIRDMLDEMLAKELVRINITFPLIDMSYSRNLTYDMQVKDVASIFLPDAVLYSNMTKSKSLFVSEIHHNSLIRMTESGFQFTSMTFLTMKVRNNSLKIENERILQDLIRKHLDVEEPDFLKERVSYKKTVGRENISSKRPSVTTKANRKTHIADILKGKLFPNCQERKRKRKSKKGRKSKQLRNGKSYKPIPAPSYLETKSTLSLNNSRKMHPDFLGGSQATTESLQSGTEAKEPRNGKSYKPSAPAYFGPSSKLSLNINELTIHPDILGDSQATTENLQSRTEDKELRNGKSYKPPASPYFGPTNTLSLNNNIVHPEILDDSQATTESSLSRTEPKELRNGKSYKAPALSYFEPKSTLSLNMNAFTMPPVFLGNPQATTESCSDSELGSCTNSKVGHYAPLTSEGIEMYRRESSRKPEVNRKSMPAGVTSLGYESKNYHRQDKALLPDDPTTKWGFFRPRFTWTGPVTSTKGYTFKQQSVLSITIKQSFFYAIVNQNTGTIFALGKVANCKA